MLDRAWHSWQNKIVAPSNEASARPSRFNVFSRKNESSYSACKLSGIFLVTSRNSRTFGTGVEEARRAERGMSADGKSVLRIPGAQVGWMVVNEPNEQRDEKSAR